MAANQIWVSEIDSIDGQYVEMYAFGAENIICWTEDFKYKVFGSNGSEVYSGQIDETLPQYALPLTQINCRWFCPMGTDSMLYVAFRTVSCAGGDVQLRLWNFKTETSVEWAPSVVVKREFFHNFAWLHYNPQTKRAQLCWQDSESTSQYLTVLEGAAAEVTEVGCTNPTLFSVHNHTLYMNCNYHSGDMKVYSMHPDGSVNMTTIELDAEAYYTAQEIGFLEDNWFYIIAIEGQGGLSKKHTDGRGHTVGALMINTITNPFENGLTHETGSLTWVELEAAPVDSVPDIPDGFWKYDKESRTMYATCSNNNWISWLWTQVDGVWTVISNKDKKEEGRGKLDNYCSSWDKETLFCFSQGGKVLNVQVHETYNRRLKYFWLLMSLTKLGGPTTKWQAPVLREMADMLT